ncbi:N-6 DNA methylase [Acidobacteria bacterium AH-259-L09]|nr:N-6 DNA methylase [Acidobacteria bacterium AH-259-L09]
MQVRRRQAFTTIQTQGAILPPDLLQRVADGDGDLEGLKPGDYHLTPGERLNEAANRAWNRLQGCWASFQSTAGKLPGSDIGTTVTRERWLLPLFQELGYGRLQTERAADIEGKSYPISHCWQKIPIHLVGFRVDLDRRMTSVAGAARSSPHSLVQEFLNRSEDHLWAFLSNGLKLRILRDNLSLTRQAYVEFDVEAMMQAEAYSDFVLLWLLCHQSRVEGDRPEQCWLEKWSQVAHQQGTRALDQLRDGVEDAIKALGRGFLSHPANQLLRDRLQQGSLTKQDYYRQLLRLVYRLLFLFVAEDREQRPGFGVLLHSEADIEARDRYYNYYSTTRLRRLAERLRGSRHADLYESLKIVMGKLAEEGCPELGLPSLGSFLFSPHAIENLKGCQIANHDLLDAIRALAFTSDQGILRPVDYKNLGSEEFGSVYESLLELEPEVNADAGTFEFTTVSGHERKTTGSYYTPSSLVNCLLDSALDPVLDEAARKPEPERSILSLKICDPACGSGHFLIAAAHRIAKRLAAVRTGDEEPSPEASRTALRDVIGHCIYGVDVNPMAVELCKVALWMEAIDPGKPLSFLDHKIQCGNSLLGTTPKLLAEGIPDGAFKPIEGDDKSHASALRRRNKQERKGQRTMWMEMAAERTATYGSLSDKFRTLDQLDDVSIEAVHEKQERYYKLAESAEYQHARLIADAWCAAFVWRKTKHSPEVVTEDVFRTVQADPSQIPHSTIEEIKRLGQQYSFFHWHLAFPEVFRVAKDSETAENEQVAWSGGFDVVLGNPPWERIKLQEKEWFASRHEGIANAPNAAARRRLIQALASEDLALFKEFQEARRHSEGGSHLVRSSGRYPLCGRGDVNTYSIFAETKRLLLSPVGRVGCIVPSGIATDDTTKFFFQNLMESRSLVSLYDFENRHKLFPAVDSRMKFCLLTLTSPTRPAIEGAEFVFFALSVADLSDRERHFSLTSQDLELLNPNTRTCPIFRSRRDANLCKTIRGRVPAWKTPDMITNSWGHEIRRIIDINARGDLLKEGGEFKGQYKLNERGDYVAGDLRFLRLYEGKMIYLFHHRLADAYTVATGQRSGRARAVPADELTDPNRLAVARAWVEESSVIEQLPNWPHSWLFAYMDVCSVTNERTVIGTVVPWSAPTFSLRVLSKLKHDPCRATCLLANFGSFVFDYYVRQFVGGLHLSDYIMNQMAVLPPDTFENQAAWDRRTQLLPWVTTRVIELCYTAWDLEPFAKDCGYSGPPFIWDETRRFLIRSELDAAYFRLYGIGREDVNYIMETFPIVKRKDEQAYGEYRTKRVILEIYDHMQHAIDTGQPYQTLLDPPPVDPRVAHPPLEVVK